MKYLRIHLVMLAIATSGCGSDSQPSVVELELPSGEQTLQLEKDEATQSWTVIDPATSERVIVEQGGFAWIGDHVVVVAPGAPPVVHRHPKAITDRLSQLPRLYLRSGTLEEVIVEGFQGNPIADPETGEHLCWLAATCKSASCSGQGHDGRPYLFILEHPGVQLGADGTIVRPPPSLVATPGGTPSPCPACGRVGFMVPYEIPAAAKLRKELRAELKSTHDALDTVRK
jgi:hypothetical protein